jgi:hypothetical protein
MSVMSISIFSLMLSSIIVGIAHLVKLLSLLFVISVGDVVEVVYIQLILNWRIASGMC